MTLDHGTLDAMRHRHPAWRLLLADSAPLVASFLHRVFVAANVRAMSQANLAEALDDTLYALREEGTDAIYPKAALEYLDDWAANERGWLRKFYPPGSDEPHFDPTPAAEKAITWLVSLGERGFVGTESRLLTLFSLLEQMSEGSQSDPDLRLRELHRRRAEIDAEIERVEAGDFTTIADTSASVELPMERPLYSPPLKPVIADVRPESGEAALDAGALFAQFVVDKVALARHIDRVLQERSLVTLPELLQTRPLQQGLAELVAYLELAAGREATVIDDETDDAVTWLAANGVHKRARLPRVVFSR